MKTVRRGCFETNSSSMHSIVVTKNDVHITPEEVTEMDSDEYVYVHNDGIMSLWEVSEGYGRSFDVLTTFYDKLKYSICEYLGGKYADEDDFDKTYDKLLRIAKNVIPSLKDFRFDIRDVDMYLDEDGNNIPTKSLIYKGWDSETGKCRYAYLDSNGNEHDAIFDEKNYMETPDIGVIDHQSAGILKTFLEKHKISLEEFLTNKKYIIVVDGDEYCIWDAIKHSGVGSFDGIVEEFPAHGDDE